MARLVSHLLARHFCLTIGSQGNVHHLKRVIVTPAVYALLARLDPGLKYTHWADVTDYTQPCGLAVSCVFVKQSGPPSHCTLHSQTCVHERRDSLCRRHGAILPSSLTYINSFTP